MTALTLTIQPTDEMRVIGRRADGRPLTARIWQGEMDDGTPVHLLVTTVAVHTSEPGQDRLADRLTETAPLTDRTREVFDLRYFVD